jgi:hypothetical protein
MMEIKAVGIPWYRQQDFDRLKAMFSEGSIGGKTTNYSFVFKIVSVMY